MPIKFSDHVWQDYLFCQYQDRATPKRVNKLLREKQRSPFEEIGKPEPLKQNLSGFWFRRIDEEDRLVYALQDDTILMTARESQC